jgi:hypothetical protein
MNSKTAQLRENGTEIVRLFARFALGASFLSAVADRFGLWGPYGAKNVSWGNFAHFVEYTLGGQCKTGHAGSLQNRPYEMARDVILFILLSPGQASLFWFSNSAARI